MSDAPAERALVRVAFPATRPGDADGSGDGDSDVDRGSVPNVALVTLDRPGALNALSHALVAQLVDSLHVLDADPECRCIVITGSGERAFAAGADIGELVEETTARLATNDPFARWDEVGSIRTPLIAAVRGFALGGGCELAMACDMVVAGDDARFGQPEIKIGVIPGAGGTQRLTRIVGKPRAMELILTGRTIDAREAERIGLVTRVVPASETLAVALGLASTIASMPPLAVRAAKEAILQAEELALRAGLAFERRSFYLLFDTEDQREGMSSFIEKRAPAWKGR